MKYYNTRQSNEIKPKGNTMPESTVLIFAHANTLYILWCRN